MTDEVMDWDSAVSKAPSRGRRRGTSVNPSLSWQR